MFPLYAFMMWTGKILPSNLLYLFEICHNLNISVGLCHLSNIYFVCEDVNMYEF